MTSIPKKVGDRLSSVLKRFQPIIGSARARDVNESDTVLIITDLLSELFGFDKYSEITTEHSIRGTFCDLAIKLDGKVALLIEAKAIGLELKDQHVKQAVDYAANQGVEWVILTNSVHWKIFHVTFGKPIDQELVLELDILSLNSKESSTLECLYLLSKEGMLKATLPDYHKQIQAINRFTLGAILLSEPVLSVVRRELKRLSSGARIDPNQIKSMIEAEVLKRDVVEGEKAKEAKKKVQKTTSKILRTRKAETEEIEDDVPVENETAQDTVSTQETTENKE